MMIVAMWVLLFIGLELPVQNPHFVDLCPPVCIKCEPPSGLTCPTPPQDSRPMKPGRLAQRFR